MQREWIGPILNSYWVRPGVFLAGGYPGASYDKRVRQDLRRLLLVGVALFLDLTQEGEYGLEPYASLLLEDANALGRSVEYRRMPIPDMETPTHEEMTHVLDTIDSALEANHAIYLHCFAGMGRTGTVVGCYLVRHGVDGKEALSEIAHLRRGAVDWWDRSPVTPAQRAMVREWPAEGW